MMSEQLWREKELNPLRILLDAQNPRIEVPHGANQTFIRKKLIEFGKVISLANSIIEFGGLLRGERVIVCKEGNRYTVLEGNRRVCACQIILDRDLLPPKLRRSLKRVNSDLKERIQKMKTEVAPTRDDAEPVITKRHTDVGVVQWSTVAKWRRASKLLEEGYSLDEIAEKLSAPKPAIRQAIREYRLFHHAVNLGGWSESEVEILTDERLKTNPYTRFFNVSGVKEWLGLSFDKDEQPETKLSQEEFDKKIRHIAFSFLIPTNDNKPAANTRTPAHSIFSTFNPDEIVVLPKQDVTGPEPSQENEPSRAQKNRTRSKPKAATASTFFENLNCTVQDQRLIGITYEITRIDYKAMPIAASMLLRGLLEAALNYQVRAVKKTGDLHKYLQEKNKGSVKDVGLSDLIKFCGAKKNNVFISPRAADALLHSSVSVYKEHLDIIIHGKWAEADDTVLVKAATALRPIINDILEGHTVTHEDNCAP